MAELMIWDGVKSHIGYHRRMAVGETVLVVEDDADVRRMFRAALTLTGFNVLEAHDGLTALHILEQRTPDLVVLDLLLPSVDGLTVQQEIAARAELRSVPIIIVTGSDLPLDHLQVPCVLRKPVTGDDLVAAVRRCLSSGASSIRS